MSHQRTAARRSLSLGFLLAAVACGFAGAGEENFYAVQAGDTLRSIAKAQFGSEWLQLHLREWNKIDADLRPGTVIRWPKALVLVTLPFPLGAILPPPDRLIRNPHGGDVARVLPELTGWEETWEDALATIPEGSVNQHLIMTTDTGLVYVEASAHKKGGRIRLEAQFGADGRRWTREVMRIVDAGRELRMETGPFWEVSPRGGDLVPGDSLAAAKVAAAQARRWPGRVVATAQAGDALYVAIHDAAGSIVLTTGLDRAVRRIAWYDPHGRLLREDDRRVRTIGGRSVVTVRRVRSPGSTAYVQPGDLARLCLASSTGFVGAREIREVCEWKIGAGTVHDIEFAGTDSGFSIYFGDRPPGPADTVWFNRQLARAPDLASLAVPDIGCVTATRWTTSANGEAWENLYGLASLADGGVIAAGQRSGPGPDRVLKYQHLVRAFDSGGVLRWEVVDGPPSGKWRMGELVVVGADGSIGVVGRGDGGDEWRSFDSRGRLTGTRLIEGSRRWDYGPGIKPALRGRLIVCGTTEREGESGRYEPMIALVSPTGAREWARTYPPRNGRRRGFTDVAAAPSGGFVAAGSLARSESGDDEDALLAGLDANGSIRWEHVTGENTGRPEEFSRVVAGEDGTVVAAGGMLPPAGGRADWLIQSFDARGRLRWTRSYDGVAGLADHVSAVAVAGSGRVIVVGSEQSDDEESDKDAVALGLDAATGEIRWRYRLAGPGRQAFKAAAAASDGSVWLAAYDTADSKGAASVIVRIRECGTGN